MNESTSQVPPPQQPHEEFFAAQRRNRRATWRISALCAVAIAVAGIPLTLIVTPLLYAGFMAGAAVVDYFTPLSPSFWRQVDDLTRVAGTAGDFLFNHRPADPQVLTLAAIAFLGPGILLAIGIWTGVFALLKRGGVGGTLMTLGARAPNRSDAGEMQLDDVVQEMALAARMEPLPRVFVIDTGGANAAAIGTSAADAHLIVSRGLIENLRREEMQGAIAHLLASIGNGDLRIAFRITSVFETLGLMVTMLNAPFGPHARATLGRIVHFALRRDRADSAAEAEAIATMLAAGITMESDDIFRLFDSPPRRGIVGKALNALLLPFFFTNAAIQLTLWFLSVAMLGPSFALLWRTRKYLADATSVQLTRNPDALASALEKLKEQSSGLGIRTATPYLFIVSPGPGQSAKAPRPDQMQAAARAWASINDQAISGLGPADLERLKTEIKATRLAAMRGDREAMVRLARFATAMAAERRAGEQVDRTQGAGGESPEPQTSGPLAETIVSFHPSISRRLARLRRMGSHLEDDSQPPPRALEIVLAVILGPPLLLVVVLFVILIAMMIMLNLVILSLWFAVIHLIVALIVAAITHR